MRSKRSKHRGKLSSLFFQAVFSLEILGKYLSLMRKNLKRSKPLKDGCKTWKVYYSCLFLEKLLKELEKMNPK